VDFQVFTAFFSRTVVGRRMGIGSSLVPYGEVTRLVLVKK